MLAGLHADIPELEGESGSPGYSSKVQAVVPMSPPTDFTVVWRDLEGNPFEESRLGPITQLLGGPIAEKPELARLASPAAFVAPGDAPSLILHGTMDEIVPFHQAELLVEAMARAGNDATLIAMTGVDHSAHGHMYPESADPFGTRQAVVEFFTRRLGPVSMRG